MRRLLPLAFLLLPAALVNAQTPADSAYNSAWRRAAAFEEQGQPRSALAVVDSVYALAKARGHRFVRVRAALTRARHLVATEDTVVNRIVADLRREVEEADALTRPILHAHLAETYAIYFRENRWRIAGRTETAGSREDDVATWTLRDLASAAASEHRAAILALEGQEAVPAARVAYLLAGDPATRPLRPTLLDVVGHAALDFFASGELTSAFPEERFRLEGEAFFADADAFARIALAAPADTSFQAEAVRLFQRLTAAHLADGDPSALIDVTVRRLAFARAHSTLPDRDARYEAALRALLARHPDAPHATLAALRLSEALVEGDASRTRRQAALDLCTASAARFPNTTGAAGCRALVLDIRAPELSVQVEEAFVPGAPFRALVAYRNVPTVHLRVVRPSAAWLARWERTNEYEARGRMLRELAALAPAEAQRVSLPGGDDLGMHRVEVPMQARAAGTYALLASADGTFPVGANAQLSFAFFQATTLAAVTRPGDGAVEAHVLDRASGGAVAGANVRLLRREYRGNGNGSTILVAQGTTDARGFVRIVVAPDQGYEVEVRARGEVLRLGGVYTYREGAPEMSTRAFFFTDRALYRPGQSVQFKVLVLDSDGERTRLQTSASVRVQLIDANGQEAAQALLTTNEFGSASGMFTAPDGVLTGAMQLVATVGGDGVGSQAIRVEEYRRPRFEVVFAPVEGTPVFGEMVTAAGTATSYAGVPLEGARVAYRVVRQPAYWWWGGYGRGGGAREEEEIANGIATTGADGRFAVPFTPRADPGDRPEGGASYRYRVLADVLDVSGETQSASTSLTVGFTSLRAALALPETVDLAGADTFRVVTENLSGTPTPAAGTVRFDLLRGPGRALRARLWERPDTHVVSRERYVALFPHDVYDDEDDVSTWPSARTLGTFAFDTAARPTVRLGGFAGWPEGIYRVTVSTRDAAGRPVETVQTVTVVSSRTRTMFATPIETGGVIQYDAPTYRGRVVPSRPSGAAPVLVWSAALTTTARPGETAVFLVGSPERGVRVRVDVEIDGRIERTEWLALDAEKRRVEVPVTEAMRGGFGVHLTAVRGARVYAKTFAVDVPRTDRALAVTVGTFRDRIQPGSEQAWTLRIAGADGSRVAAEVAAAMYDASLDAIAPHAWAASFLRGHNLRRGWSAPGGFSVASVAVPFERTGESPPEVVYETLDRFGFESFNAWQARYARRGGAVRRGAIDALENQAVSANEVVMEAASPAPTAAMAVADASAAGEGAGKREAEADAEALAELGGIQARRNLQETVFFFPHLRTDADGSVTLTFTAPEALTRWNLLAFAHTQDAKTGQLTAQTVTEKDLMVTPNAPRFFREGDAITFTARVDNRADAAQSIEAALFVFDAATMQPADTLVGNTGAVRRLTLAPDSSAALAWTLRIPDDAAEQGSGAYVYRVVARSAQFSDGEEALVPVLTNRTLVTETLPLPIRGGTERTFTLDRLLASAGDRTIQPYRLTLEFTPNPAWYAVAALPYLAEGERESASGAFARYYANRLAATIANSDPRIRAVFEAWRRADAAVLTSNLERNEELKAVLLEQTPWVAEAQDDTERRRRIALLFDLARMNAELETALRRLEELQDASGAWPWFRGFPGDRYTTQRIVAGMGRLRHLGALDARHEARVSAMAAKAVRWLDAQVVEDLRRTPRTLAPEPSPIYAHYLYARAFFPAVAPDTAAARAIAIARARAVAGWQRAGFYEQGLVALALHRMGDAATPARILRSLKEFARTSDELGMYWPEAGGYLWHQAPVERQALLIEAFSEIARDAAAVGEMKLWLLKQKQVQSWKTTTATADAVYALLLAGPDRTAPSLLAETPAVTIRVGAETFDARRLAGNQEAGTGYFKQTWPGEAIRPEMGRVAVANPGRGAAWGALYLQYFAPIDAVTRSQNTPLRLEQRLFVERASASGPVLEPLGEGAALRVGDKLVQRLVVRVDRAMEYVHLRSLRASGLEPIEQVSGYEYRDGLGWYQSARDASTDFFFGWLPAGTYVFEYGLRVRHAGEFSGALSSIQSVYAPEFAAHTQGERIRVAP